MKSINLENDKAFLALSKEKQQRMFTRFVSTGFCWIYQGKSGRYGRVRAGSHKIQANRAAYLATHGEIPEGMVVCHRCNNPRCINPEHLKLGTQQDNMADRSRAGRQWLQKDPSKSSFSGVGKAEWRQKGTAVHAAKLTESDIPIVRALYKSGIFQKEIAARFGVSQTSISQVITGRTWSHVPNV